MLPRKKFKFLGCEIIYREACYLAARSPHRVDVEFLRKGLHDLKTQDMLAKVQETIDRVDPADGYEAILLGYARCNNGIVGLTARTIPIVVPRAHDCITFFFGSRTAYREYFDAHPGTYYMTTGWRERNRSSGDYAQPAYGQQGVMGLLGLTESYEQMVEKYGKENADFVIASLGGGLQHYTHFLYLKMGACDESDYIDATREEARGRNWEFLLRDGDWTLMEKLFYARWDDDFITVQPGQKITARADEGVLDVQ